MKQKRLAWLFGIFLASFWVVLGKLFLLAQNQLYAHSAQMQTVVTLELENGRGNLYDRKGRPLTGGENRYYALSVPGQSDYASLFRYVPYRSQAVLYEKRNTTAPFLIEVDRDLTDQQINTYTVRERYKPQPLARHLVGYLNGDGTGAAGLEAAFDEVLGNPENKKVLRCVTTAQGTLLKDSTPRLMTEGPGGRGLLLTLDQSVQHICEGVARVGMSRGCILVLDVKTGEILASVSLPQFEPDAVYKSIQAEDTSLMNRSLCAFNVGSVFKPILAAAALERGWDWYTHDCKGWIDVNGQVYRCAEGRAHGTVNLRQAMEKSCNCFFIDLGQKLAGDTLYNTASAFGFGEPIYLGGGMKSAAGSLPDEVVLQDLGQLANLSFGQGQLTATPLQVAAAVNTIAGNGKYCTPVLLRGTVEEKTGRLEPLRDVPHPRQIIREDTASRLRRMMVAVVENGLGKDATPEYGGAGGKTGTAQTGSCTEGGDERMNYWFAGFYPAENPRYTLVVMQDGLTEPKVSSAALFRQVCDGLYWLENHGENS